jgi:hypothetical protein
MHHTRLGLLLMIVLLCSHCTRLPTSLNPDTPLNPQQAHYLNQWLTQSDLSHAQWLLDQQHLLDIVPNKNPSQLKRAQQKLFKQQQLLATQLLNHCQQLSADTSPLLLTQCHSLLHKLPLDATLTPQLQQLSKPKFAAVMPIVRNTPTNNTLIEATPAPDITASSAPPNGSTASSTPLEKPINSTQLLQLCQQNAQKGKWLHVRQQLIELKSQPNLGADSLRKIQLIERQLSNALEQMDARAELLYQDKKIIDAQKIWIEILQIAPEQQDIRNKHQRAQTVLDNIKALRQQPDTTP